MWAVAPAPSPTSGRALLAARVAERALTRAEAETAFTALFEGAATPDVVRSAASATEGSYRRSQRLCEAEFYIAEFQLMRGEKAAAMRGLEAMVKSCPIALRETAFAKAELARLKG